MKKTRGWKIFAAVALLLFGISVLAGCGSTMATDEEYSPTLVNAEITSYNEGSVSEQYVKAVLEFDQDISIREDPDDSMRITIAQERVQSDEYTLTHGGYYSRGGDDI